MDALKFLKERKRMCDTYYNKEWKCACCPATKAGRCLVGIDNKDFFWGEDSWKTAIKIVKKWRKKYPKN